MKNLTLTIVVLVLISCNHRKLENAAKMKKDSVAMKIDTLHADNYILTFEKADSFKRTDIFGDLDTRLKMTEKVYNSLEQAQIIQKYLSNKLGKYFYTTDTTLVLKFSNGKTESFPFWDERNNDKDSVGYFEGFYLEHYFEKIDYFLLSVERVDEGCWMLVNRKNGLKKYIYGLPYISLDNTKIITINSDLESQYTFNGIEMYSVMSDSLKLEFSKETTWGPIDLKWLNGNEVLLKRRYFYTDSITNAQKDFFDFCNMKIENKNAN